MELETRLLDVPWAVRLVVVQHVAISCGMMGQGTPWLTALDQREKLELRAMWACLRLAGQLSCWAVQVYPDPVLSRDSPHLIEDHQCLNVGPAEPFE